MSFGSTQAIDRLSSFADAYRGKRVWVTGHTGFKGAWLCEWLLVLGADVTGYSLPAPTQPALSEQLDLRHRLRHVEADVRDLSTLTRSLTETEPDYVFHLAAQPLVRESYADPLGTFSTNILGTANVLQALRSLPKPCAAVIVTSDKCYENRDWVFGYREEDALGGHDPYSASKGAAEIIVASMRRSFFTDHPVRVASGRAGNVIGGGDWAKDRIVPDCVRALQDGQAIPVRNRFATRPWQHVLEPLSGYLWLAAQLAQPSTLNSQLNGAFNFGPHHDANRTVAELVAELLKHWPGRWEDRTEPQAPHEAKLLQLATDKAHALLGWSPVWSFADAVEHTAKWYRGTRNAPQQVLDLTRRQIQRYQTDAANAGLPWVQ
jgi:CDP-glucose 4,6-dehydratase